MIKYRNFFTFIFITSLFFSCKKTEKIKVGFLLPHLNVQRYIAERDEFLAIANQKNVDAFFYCANNNSEIQETQFDELLKSNVDIIVLCPVNRFTAAGMVRRAHKQGVKVISHDRFIFNCEVDAFVSFDGVMTGEQMAKALVTAVPQGNYVVFGGDKSDMNAIAIDEGENNILNPLVKSGKIKIKYKIFIPSWSTNEAQLEMKRYLDLSNEVPDAILSSSDGIAIGVVNCLKEYGLEGKIPLVGQNADFMACRNVLNGYQLMTVYKPGLGALAFELAVKMANNENVSSILNTTRNNGYGEIPSRILATIPLDKSNLKSVLVKNGIYKESDLN